MVAAIISLDCNSTCAFHSYSGGIPNSISLGFRHFYIADASKSKLLGVSQISGLQITRDKVIGRCRECWPNWAIGTLPQLNKVEFQISVQ